MKRLWPNCIALIMSLLLMLPAIADEANSEVDAWRCPSCDALNAYAGNYCEECGAPRPSTDWICPDCGRTNDCNYCEECGAARPSTEWICHDCGRTNDGNYCEECGAKRDSAPQQTPRMPEVTPAPEPKLAPDPILDSEDSLHVTAFGSTMERRNVASITLLSSIADAPDYALDISADGNGGVLMWFESAADDMYDMYIAAQGRIKAPENCEALFSYYIYCKEIHLNDCLDTSETSDMSHMFSCCWALEELDGISFDTSNVTSMLFMFSNCSKLVQLDLSSFDTASVTTMNYMFNSCDMLEQLDISSFVLNDSATTRNMFADCDNLPASSYAHIDYTPPTPSPAPTPVIEYEPLSRNSKGAAVTELQQQLIRYGYLAQGEADGSYGRRTAEAVHRFKQQNGISDYGQHYATECIATSEMQQRLFSGSAAYYFEPSFPLTFPSGSTARWYKTDNDLLAIKFEATNISAEHTVNAFKVEVYAEDVWGDKLYDDLVYYETTRTTIAPSDYKWSEYLYIPECSDIYKVYARISEVQLSDGTHISNTSYDYASWLITYD